MLNERKAGADNSQKLLYAAIALSLLGAALVAGTLSNAFRNHLHELQTANAALDERVDLRTRQLQASETRQRLALEAGELGVWEVDLNLSSSQRSLRHDQIFGYENAVERWSVDRFLEHVYVDDRERVSSLVEAAQTGQTSWRYDCRIIRTDNGQVRWIEVAGAPQMGPDGKVRGFAGIIEDITERVVREQRLAFVTGELEHRSKNLMTVIQAISYQTARHTSSIDEYQKAFQARLAGPSRSTDILLGREGAGADLKELVNAHLGAFSDPQRLNVDGPPVRLKPTAAQTIGLALHELGTNSYKYGALSVPQGQINVTWVTGPDGVNLEWREAQGPMVAPPMRKGFGTAVIETMTAQALGGKVSIEFLPSGLLWLAKIPRDQLA